MDSPSDMDVIKDAFREAALKNIPHIANAGWADMNTFDPTRVIERGMGGMGYCAAEWLVSQSLWASPVLGTKVNSCPLCNVTTHTKGSHHGIPIKNLGSLVVHYNNEHRMTWLDLANKL